MGTDRDDLVELLRGLSEVQLEIIEPLLRAVGDAPEFTVSLASDFATVKFAATFGAILCVHHAVSHESFTKDKFEHALEKVLSSMEHEARRAPRGYPGRDLDVDDQRWSLKTQADSSIRTDEIHISKFMELGRGAWGVEEDLYGLREQMFEHMTRYDRILTLRCLSQSRRYVEAEQIEYELVEIPKGLLERSADFPCQMHQKSRQNPKPGSCKVLDINGARLFELYFDGGAERKLQVRHLAKSVCILHAAWSFRRLA